MGVGKSTIGKRLALRLHWTFKDSDQEIQQRTGATIPLIFDLEGEEGFRKREKNVIAELVQQPRLVLATGGGAILLPENREQLKQHGTIIYLRASIDELLKRTANSRNRPLLETPDPRARLEQLMRERAHLYESLADYIVETGQRNISQVLKTILDHLTEESLNDH
ncbi:shikimate kinase I [Thioflexithrix psekupsensis]|uniref:Shikimate kinase n=2 Tax=Thioflexithrix psekupsensis TaxID=1570016 RepID=A0A251X6F3_9GAMM|nr:shikimate kinase I [Thioflexithrix psekupsensis]